MLSLKKNAPKTWKGLFERLSLVVNFDKITQFIQTQKQAGKVVFPPEDKIFDAFKKCSYLDVKVLILGQDPYHQPHQAHGLSFSVPDGVKIPPSLRNIFKELSSDLGLPAPNQGNLAFWAEQGVLLLNAILTVNANEPASHKQAGWEAFTDALIHDLSTHKEHLVFILWGSYASAKADLIDSNKHLILQAVHPSPLSAHRGFFGCRHFSKTNEYLLKHHGKAINWTKQSQVLLDFPNHPRKS